jgi:hypothetical protein
MLSVVDQKSNSQNMLHHSIVIIENLISQFHNILISFYINWYITRASAQDAHYIVWVCWLRYLFDWLILQLHKKITFRVLIYIKMKIKLKFYINPLTIMDIQSKV